MSNMEVFYRPNNDITVKAEVRSVEEMFQVIGPLQELFGAAKCQKCGGTNIRFIHRKADKFDMYELLCESEVSGSKKPCGAKLELGKNEHGNFFPRRYEQEKGEDGKWRPKVDADGKKVWLPNGGWIKWDGKQQKYV